jgi:hypothetical protein
MRLIFVVLVLLTARAAVAQDTVDVRADRASVINWGLERPYTSRFEGWRHSDRDSTKLFAGENVVTQRDVGGRAELIVATEPDSPDTMRFDIHTLAFLGAAKTPHDPDAFHGPTSDIMIEFLPRRLGVVYRARLWYDGQGQSETHLYETKGREDIQVFGKQYRNVWVVDDWKAATRKLTSRLWLIDQPPYMLRWEFFDAPEVGSRIVASQEAIGK